MLKISAYVLAFFILAAISFSAISYKFKPELPIVDSAWSFISRSKEKDKTIILYEDDKRFNEYTITNGEKRQRIYLKDKLVLAWDKTLSYKPGSAEFANVISPPLFALENTNGEIFMKELSDTKSYIKNCDKPVWGMYTNGYNPDNTRIFITNDVKRNEITEQITKTACMHNMEGVNIDFENMYSEDADYFTLFIKELSEKLHKNNIILSVDVTKINTGSNFYSMCYNRAELCKYADYIILMAYDQFPRTSTVAGPIASIPWTEDAILGVLSEVPQERLILGIPLYTRNWIEKDGLIESCPAISMIESNELISTHTPTVYSDTETGMHYFQFEHNGAVNKVWQENETSVQKRCDLADKYNLSGIACWSLGYESGIVSDTLLSWKEKN